ncbi:MAG TPA: DUF502 domain-containing protein [Gammaproteobacteria bacterium]|nr:DUF502 domain-containing protein [Gammaproteobacteria bacterium]
MFKNFVTGFRRYLVAGLLIWVPLAVTVFIFSLLLGLMNGVLGLLPSAYQPQNWGWWPDWIPGQIPAIVGAVLAILILLITGFLGANLIGRRLVHTYERILERIPLVRSVYGSVKHFAEIVFAENGTSFKQVLMIEYPRPGLYSLCFLTSENPREVQRRTNDDVVTVFLPTTPNPTSGFMLFVPRKDIIELDMPIDDALKMIISLGVVVPKWHEVHPDHELAQFKGRS